MDLFTIKQEINTSMQHIETPKKADLRINFKPDPYDDDVIYMGTVQPFMMNDDYDDDEYLLIASNFEDGVTVKSEKIDKPETSIKVDKETGITDGKGSSIVIKDNNGNTSKRKSSGSDNQSDNQDNMKKAKTKNKKKKCTQQNKNSPIGSNKKSTATKSSTVVRKGIKGDKITKSAGQNVECIPLPQQSNKENIAKGSASDTQIGKENKSNRDSFQNTGHIKIKNELDSDVLYICKAELDDSDVLFVEKVQEPLVISDEDDDELIYIHTETNHKVFVKSEKQETKGKDLESTDQNGIVNKQDKDNILSKEATGKQLEHTLKNGKGSIDFTRELSSNAYAKKLGNNTLPIVQVMEGNQIPSKENGVIANGQSSVNTQCTSTNQSNRSTGQRMATGQGSATTNKIINTDIANRTTDQSMGGNQIHGKENRVVANSKRSATTDQIINSNILSRSTVHSIECIPILSKENKSAQTTAMFPKHPDYKIYSEKLGYLYRNSNVYFLKYAKDIQSQEEFMFVYRRSDNMIRVFIKSEEEELFMKSFYDLVTCKYAFEYIRGKMLPKFNRYIYETIQKRRQTALYPDQNTLYSVVEKLVKHEFYFIIQAKHVINGDILLIVCPTWNFGIFRIYNKFTPKYSEIYDVFTSGINMIDKGYFEFCQLKMGFLHWMSGQQ